MIINHGNINTRQIIQPKDPCTHSDTQALLGGDSMHTTGYCYFYHFINQDVYY